MRDELEANAANANRLVNETTMVVDESLMKSNISQSRLYIDSRYDFTYFHSFIIE